MAYVAYLRRPKQGEPFDPYCNSKVGTSPVLPNEIREPGHLKCGTCGKELLFLLQLGASYKETIRRMLLVYFCKDHLKDDSGWALYRYTSMVEQPSVPTMSAFDEMNSLSSWVSDMDISSSTEQKGIIDALEGQRIIIEEDFVSMHDVKEDNTHSERLFASYKQRNREDIDEEDLIDIDNIEYARNNDDTSDDGSISDPDDIKMNPNLMEFQLYVAERPGVIMRYHWAGRPLYLEELKDSNTKCNRCGEPRAFEFQLLPEFMKHISLHASPKASLQIGSILFYTCGNDCQTGDSFVKEHLNVLMYC